MYEQTISWGWLIIIYLFLGGLAGGAYIISALSDLCEIDENKLVAKIGFLVAFFAIIIGAICLIFDLGRPERFLHVLKVFKFTSPMSMGVWGVIAFTFFSVLSVLMIFGTSEESRGLWKLGYYINCLIPRKVINVIGLTIGIFLAGYTGVLLTETSRPFWSDTPFLGALFLASGVSTAIAFIYFFYALKRNDDIGQKNKYKLKLVDNIAILIEMVILLFMMIELANIDHLSYVAKYKTLWIIGVVIIGLILPVIFNFISIGKYTIKKKKLGFDFITPILILIGGFILRYVVVRGGQL